MMYEADRHHLTATMNELRRWGLLNPGGGAISVRTPDNRMVISTTGSASRLHWDITAADHIVLDMDGRIVEQSTDLGASGTPLHLALYEMLPDAGAIIHVHAPHSLVFASLGREIPSTTNRCDALGQIPCLSADDEQIKRDYKANPFPVDIPEGMVQRADVAAVTLLHYVPLLEKVIKPRADEVARHPLAFTLARHGIVVVGTNIGSTMDALFRVEESAECALMAGALTGGAIHSNRALHSGA